MKTTQHNLKQPLKMKKLLLLLLLFTGMVKAQPPIINTPQDHIVFDVDNNNYEFFNVYTLTSEILGTLNANEYTVKYYNDTSYQSIISDNNYNYCVNNQMVYVKVSENANQSNFATTSFAVILIPTPIISQAQDIFQMDIPYDYFGTFDLTTLTAGVLNGLTNMTVEYYPSYEDAQNGQNLITNPSSYTNISNPQLACVKVINQSTGSFSFSKFRLVLTSAEVVNIPDAALLNRLSNYDTNGDGTIQVSEALSVTYLEINGAVPPFSDTTGLERFTNVTNLLISNNFLTNFNATIFQNLKVLECFNNLLTYLNVNGMNSLESINCTQNLLPNIDVNNCPNLKYLYCSNNNITLLNINNLINLESLYCSNNQLSNLEINNLTNIENITCTNNQLTNLDISNLTTLNYLFCSDNLLTTLNLSGLTNLRTLSYGNPGLNTVDLSSLINLYYISYGGGLQTTIDLSNLIHLEEVLIWNSNLTSLDVSNIPYLSSLKVIDNPSLNYINMKTGGQFRYLSLPVGDYDTIFTGNPNLLYVCTNEIDLAPVNAILSSTINNNNLLAHASTYCTFVPGGDFNTITGNTTFDINNDGCDITDISYPNIKIKINDGTNQGYVFSNADGIYNFYTGVGNIIVTPENENPGWFNFSPSTITIPFANNNNNITVQNFCLTTNGVHPDVEVVLSPEGIARPGFDAKYKLIFKNKGNQTLSGNVNLTFDDNRTDFVSALPSVNLQATSSLTWNYSNLLPFETRIINLVLNINSPMETPAVNSGDILDFTASVNPVAGDELPDDNIFDLHQTVVNSLDPNDIVCLEGNQVATERIGEYLHYLVRFENTGTASAVNIVVKDIIDTTKFDINTLQVISASADERTVITGNVVEFIFENINLERNTGNPPVGGHGDVLFKIKTKDNLNTGDMVINNANIYFDYNFPIITNDAETTFATLRNSGFTKDESIAVYPNPTTSRINIAANSDIKSITLYDVQGRVLETILGNTKFIDISDKANGVYFLKISTNKGSKVEKVMKE